MSTLISNLNYIESCKTDIKSAIEAQGVDMTGVSFPGYAAAIGQIAGSGYTEKEVTEGKIDIDNLDNNASFVASNVFMGNQAIKTVSLPNCGIVNDNAFKDCRSLTSVSLPVCTIIKSGAFRSCMELESISLPICASVYDNAFANCSKLSAIILSECTYIGSSAFKECGQLEEVIIPNCSLLDGYVFSKCINLSSVVLTNCRRIKLYAFDNCSSLIQLDLPNVFYLETSALTGLSNLESVSLPKCLSIGGLVMVNNQKLTEMDLPHLYYLSGAAFNLCKRITTIKVPVLGSASQWYGNGTFFGCERLSQLYLDTDCVDFISYTTLFANQQASTPLMQGVGSIYTHWQNYDRYCNAVGWSSLSSLFVSVGSLDDPLLSFDNGGLTGCAKAIHSTWSSYMGVTKNQVSTVSLPNCVYVGSDTFYEYINISECYLPNVEYVGYRGLNECFNLSNISLPNCYYIDSVAFQWCAYSVPGQHFTITLGYPGVVELGSGAGVFDNIRGGISVYVPSSLVDAYKVAPIWSSYSNYIFPMSEPTPPTVDLSFSNGLLYGDVTSIESTFIDDYSLGITKDDIYEVSLSNLEEIGASVFWQCSNLSSVSFPVLQRVGTGGLDTTNISFLYLPSFVSTTGNFAFANNSNLEYVSIPLAYIFSANAFKACTKLPGLYLNEISNFTLGLFSGCSRFTTLYYNTTYVTNMGNSNVFNGTAIRSIFLPASLINSYKTRNNWSYWKSYMEPMPTSSLSFSYMDTVFGWTTELSADYLDWLGLLPDNIYAVHLPFVSEIHSGQFADHNNLSDVYLPIVHSYPDNAFYNCGLLSLELDVNQLGSSVFKNCESLTTVTIANNNGVIPAGEDIFYGCSALSEIKVPNTLVDVYKSAQNWSEYSSIIVPSIETDVQFSNGLLYGPATSVSEADCIALGVAKTDILEVSLPECTYVDSNTFSGCTNLTSLTLSSDTSLSFGKYAFASCGLFTLSLNCLELGSTSAIATAGTDVFSNNLYLSTVNLPNCQVIGTRVFFGCSSLQTINLPMVRIIGNGAFNGCSSLESIELPACISIGLNTFMNCTSLSMLKIGDIGAVATLGNSNALASTAIAAGNGSIYVPTSLVTAYQDAKNWSFYAGQIVGY